MSVPTDLRTASVETGLGERPLVMEASIKGAHHMSRGDLHVGSSDDGSVKRAAKRPSALSLSATVGFAVARSLRFRRDVQHGHGCLQLGAGVITGEVDRHALEQITSRHASELQALHEDTDTQMQVCDQSLPLGKYMI